MQVGADDGVGVRRRRGDVAGDLRRRDPLGQKRERHGWVVAGLHRERRPIDGASVEAGRGAGLEPAKRQPKRIEGPGKAQGRGLVHAAGRDLSLADMDESAQEGTGGQHNGAGRDFLAIGGLDSGDATVANQQIFRRTLQDRQVGDSRQGRLHRRPVELAVGLGARSANRPDPCAG